MKTSGSNVDKRKAFDPGSIFLVFSLLCLGLFNMPSAVFGRVVINEIMSSNGTTIADEDGDYSDWIELYNSGEETVNLSGWGLSDNESKPFKWVFPEGTWLPGKSYLLIWASGKDKFIPDVQQFPILSSGGTWRYMQIADRYMSPNNWTSPHFNDSTWQSGESPMGWGALDSFSTELSSISDRILLRRDFYWSETSSLGGLIEGAYLDIRSSLDLDVYLNGNKIGSHLTGQVNRFEETKPLGVPQNGLILWVAGDQEITIYENDEQFRVGQWADLSGSQNHLTELIHNSGPRWIDKALNGKPAIEFDGLGDCLATIQFPTGNNVTTFMVARPDNESPSWARLYSKGSSAGGLTYSRNNNRQESYLRLDTSAQVNQTRVGSTLFDGQWHNLSMRVTGNYAESWIDSTSELSWKYLQGLGLKNNKPFIMGANYAANGGYLKGLVAEMLIYDRSLHDEERKYVESYLERKYWNKGNIPAIRLNFDAHQLMDGKNTLSIEILPSSKYLPNAFVDLAMHGQIPSNILHTNFSIDSVGEPLVITNDQGAKVDNLGSVKLAKDISYGRSYGGDSGWRFYKNATAGEENTTEEFLGILEMPNFSMDTGFYKNDMTISLSHDDPDVEIYYSLDGSEPSSENLQGKSYRVKMGYPKDPGMAFGLFETRVVNSFRYEHPISLTDKNDWPMDYASIPTMVAENYNGHYPGKMSPRGWSVRAIANREGYLSSEISSKTYFKINDTGYNIEIPIVITTIDPRHLWEYENGIMVPGVTFDEWRIQNPNLDYSSSYANYYRKRGLDGERSGHVEILKNQHKLTSKTVGIRVHGNATRSVDQKSLRIYSGRDFNGGKFQTHEFWDQNGLYTDLPLSSAKTLVIRNGGNPYQTINRIRDGVALACMRQLGFPGTAYVPALHFLNGEAWGLYEIRQRMDADFIASHYGLNETQFTMLSNDGILRHGKQQSAEDFMILKEFITTHDMSDKSNYKLVADKMDLDNFSLYYAAEIYFGNIAWPTNNIELWRVDPESINDANFYTDGRWRWQLYDLDYAMSRDVGVDSLDSALNPPSHWGRVKLNSLLKNEDFKFKFINKFCLLMNSALLPDNVVNIVDHFYNEILPYYDFQRERWPLSGSTNSIRGLRRAS